jgi:hypothetical protein
VPVSAWRGTGRWAVLQGLLAGATLSNQAMTGAKSVSRRAVAAVDSCQSSSSARQSLSVRHLIPVGATLVASFEAAGASYGGRRCPARSDH